MEPVSPKYQMSLILKISDALWKEYNSYADVLFYMKKWQEEIFDELQYQYVQNFTIFYKDKGNIDLKETLHNIDIETLLKIAIDLGIETPDFIPSIPIFRNEIKSSYKTANQTFEKAFKLIETDPDTAAGLANSTLESIIKEILKDDRITIDWKETDTLYSLIKKILTEFKFSAEENPIEIKTITSSLLAACQSIERLRSEKTSFHGKTDTDYIIDDPLYTYFIVNSITSIGLFLISFYKKKYPKQTEQEQENSFEPDDLPF